jgi:hypothetical protein
MAEELNRGQLNKYRVFGDTLVEIAAERQRQRAGAPMLPTMLATIMNDHYSQRDEAAVHAQILAAAKVRAMPNPKKEPKTEMEVLVADAPKTSAQVIGTHKIPKVTHKPPPPPKQDELSKMRVVFPRTTGGECGFHHHFARADALEAKQATRMIGGLTAAQVAADPKLAAALTKLKAHVVDAGRMRSHSGVPRGVARLSER